MVKAQSNRTHDTSVGWQSVDKDARHSWISKRNICIQNWSCLCVWFSGAQRTRTRCDPRKAAVLQKIQTLKPWKKSAEWMGAINVNSRLAAWDSVRYPIYNTCRWKTDNKDQSLTVRLSFEKESLRQLSMYEYLFKDMRRLA